MEEYEGTTLVQDILRCIAAERERNERRTGETYNSAFESYSILQKALEDKQAIEKDLKDALKQLWDGVKREDDDVVSAFLQEVSKVARESVGAWIRIGAIAEKARDSL